MTKLGPSTSATFPEAPTSRKKGSLKTVAAHTAVALATNACCWAPPLVIALTGASAGFLAFFDKYRLLLTVVTALQLTIGFYLAYRRPKHVCEIHGDTRTLNIRLMWGIAIIVILLNAHEWSHHHLASSASAVVSQTSPHS